jgi:hypothetical protein
MLSHHPSPSLSSFPTFFTHQSITVEAAIVNYYPVGSYMSGHVDDAEHAMDEPIVSINLGCPAIFLLGGRSKGDPPLPILVRSGDVIVMAHESRFCYHGVPAVLPHHLRLSEAHGTCAAWCDVCRSEGDCVDSSSGGVSDVGNGSSSSGSGRGSGSGSDSDIGFGLGLGVEVVNETKVHAGVEAGNQTGVQAGVQAGVDRYSAAVRAYLRRGRININCRRVARADGVWVDKCGSGALAQAYSGGNGGGSSGGGSGSGNGSGSGVSVATEEATSAVATI